MQSWYATPPVPIPGTPVPAQVWDTASGAMRPAAEGDTATMYVCGITPYDATHLGHAATYVAYDVLHRVLLDNGKRVVYVQNVTDIDDDILKRAGETGTDWAVLAKRETTLFRADLAAINVLPPTQYLGAVESMSSIVDLISRMHDAGAAYELEGDLYFSVASADGFGTVAGLDADTMRALSAERGGDPDRPGKKDPLDPLLWYAQRPGEPGWDSPWGPGRPGWHVECAAIALTTLGMPIDIQGGGTDLAYPHHEMCAAAAQVATGTWPFARSFVHTGMVALEGVKMSKSLGNLVFIRDLRAEFAPAAVRLALLAHHYRSDWTWTDADITAAVDRLALWRVGIAGAPAGRADEVIAEMRAHLANDLDAPAALAAVDAWARASVDAGGADTRAGKPLKQAINSLLGVAV
ncbi:MAG: cysteine--1-D-myo-inosityl 2-amino-2-deoxy-alpha-D-glucopyranoside ligase [Mycobacteriales bacterium]